MTILKLTPKEARALKACISGELDCADSGEPDAYMAALRRIMRKLIA